MPFISDYTKRTLDQSTKQDMNVPEAGWNETFDASVGMIFDESLSVSTLLNREGWDQREIKIKKMADDGVLQDSEKYYNRTSGKYDYNAVALDLNTPDIKTDFELKQERNEMLAKRREYAEGVQSRGPTSAVIAGSLAGFLSDPVNLATITMTGPLGAAKGIGVIGAALKAAGNAAVVGAGTEAIIQPFIYNHRQEIDSPYSVSDAIKNIGFAAAGGGILGGTFGGISGYLRKVVQAAQPVAHDAHVATAIEYMQKLEKTLEDGNSRVPFEELKASQLKEARTEVSARVDAKLLPAEIKSVKAELKVLRKQLKETEPTPTRIDDVDESIPADQRKRLVKEREMADDAVGIKPLKKKIAELEARLPNSKAHARAVADLAKIEKGILPDEYQKTLDGISQEQINKDVEFLIKMEEFRGTANQPPLKPEHFEPRGALIEAAPMATRSDRQKAILDETGLTENYNTAMRSFDEIKDSPIMARAKIIVDGSEVDPVAYMKAVDDDVDGIEDVLRCVLG